MHVLEEPQAGRTAGIEERDVTLLEVQRIARAQLRDESFQVLPVNGVEERGARQYTVNLGQCGQQLPSRVGEQGAERTQHDHRVSSDVQVPGGGSTLDDRLDGDDLASAHPPTEEARFGLTTGTAVAKGETTFTAQLVGILRVFAMGRRNDEAVLVIGDGEVAMHLLDLVKRETHLLEELEIVAALELAATEEGAHGEHALERADDGLFDAGREEIRQVAHRDAQRAYVRNLPQFPDLSGVGVRLDRRKRWHVPDHRQRAVLRMQREGNLPLHGELPGGRNDRRIQPCLRHTVAPRLRLNLGVSRVEKNVELCAIQLGRTLDCGRRANAIGIVQQHSEVTNTPDACFRADGRLAGFDARIAE